MLVADSQKASLLIELRRQGRDIGVAERPSVLLAMMAAWGISEENARMLYTNMAIYTHGLSTLIMAGAAFSDEELRTAMNGAFSALACRSFLRPEHLFGKAVHVPQHLLDGAVYDPRLQGRKGPSPAPTAHFVRSGCLHSLREVRQGVPDEPPRGKLACGRDDRRRRVHPMRRLLRRMPKDVLRLHVS